MAESSNCTLSDCITNTIDNAGQKSMKMTQEDLTEFGLNDQFNVVAYSVMSAGR
jgi:hypothetical protein